MSSNWNAVEAKLIEADAPSIVVESFRLHYENLCRGKDAAIRESEIDPVDQLVDAETLSPDYAARGREQIGSAAILKLNGGLGTSMGLEGPKSLLKVRGEETFLGLTLRQAQHLNAPLVLMNSFSTEQPTADAISEMGGGDLEVISFLQHQVPKIDAESLEPARWPKDPSLQWCPPGHGDIYAALVTSGTLRRLLDEGRRYLFVSNADNLGATLDEAILGYFVDSGLSFMMECADRTLADRKGGHLAKSKQGQFLLREKAQCHPDEEEQFQDVSTHRYFNTNNLWIDLVALSDYLDRNEQLIQLPTIVNRKTVDPKDVSSTAVYQLETAMGAAIGVLPNSGAMRVPRSRFAPVKTTGDLLAVRSDAYEVRPDSSVGLIAERQGVPPRVLLDSKYYRIIADLDARFDSPPSLRDCESLVVEGDLRFRPGVVVKDVTEMKGPETPTVVAPGDYRGEVRFG